MKEQDLYRIIDIACRFHRVVESHDLEPAHSADELVAILVQKHVEEPLDLNWLDIVDEVTLVTEISGIAMGHAPKYTQARPCPRLLA